MFSLRTLATALLFVLLASPYAPTSHAASIETLIMPGPVSKAHAKIDGECSNCHDRANRERQTALCLDCHKEVAADISSKSRYHGRMPQAAIGLCCGCFSVFLGCVVVFFLFFLF